jgi:secreted trypsin-like serine protease
MSSASAENGRTDQNPMKARRRSGNLVAALVCACALAALAAAPAAPASPHARASIVGGKHADPAEWPYAVAIFRKGHLHCSGSVIGPTKILTAGHCVDGFNLANFQVITGRPNLRNQSVGQVIGVSSGRVHPDFEQTGLHDVAVLNLAQPTSAPPIALATSDQSAAATLPGSPLRIAGYGATNPFGVHLSPFLKQTTELARTDRRCLKAYTRDLYAPDSMICALGAKRKKPGRFKIHTSACSGDSGGPLVADTPTGPVEVGTVSFGGALCGLPATPTVYSKVASSLDFINSG